MSELRFLGGCNEVGRSAVLLDTGSEKLLFDYGVKLNAPEAQNGKDGRTPERTNLDIDAALLTHCHLDHSGLIPALYNRGYHGNVYSTATTLDLSKILWQDSLKLAKIKGKEKDFLEEDLKKLDRRSRRVTYGQTFPVGNSNVSVYDAGHVPGCASFYVDTGDRTVLYTGDINTIQTRLMNGLTPNYPDVDVLITESTYSQQNHPPREELETNFKQKVRERINRDGTVVVPAFAIGRSQELLLVLEDLDLDVPVYLDGMAVEATKKILQYPEFLRNPEGLRKAYHDVKSLSNDDQRDKALSGPGVIVTTSGMLSGGPFKYYIQKIHSNQNCTITMTGYQVEGTAGRRLLETGVYESGDLRYEVDCDYELFDFSAHIGRDELFNFIDEVDPEKVVAMHGDEIDKFTTELEEKGYKAEGPENGETLRI
ncbi:MAG: MBL fold metallo-hydrolase [Candidatus Aenigmatarchaeota archaeon]